MAGPFPDVQWSQGPGVNNGMGQQPYIYNWDFIQIINGVRYVSYVPNPNYQAPTRTAAGPPTPTRHVKADKAISVPVAPPPHLQFNFNTIGRPIIRFIGRCRLPGNIIWAKGISASGQMLSSSFLTFATSYGSPLDPTEDVFINRMWANGTLFYDLSLGGIQPPSNMDETAVTALAACLAAMTVYHGTEGQLPDPSILLDKGAAVTPAFRGQRYIVWPEFPLQVANNTVPNLNIEFVRTDGHRLLVSDVFTRIGATFGLEVNCENIDDQCDGCVIASDKSFRSFLDQHRSTYNFQIIDRPDGSILLVRRKLMTIGASF